MSMSKNSSHHQPPTNEVKTKTSLSLSALPELAGGTTIKKLENDGSNFRTWKVLAENILVQKGLWNDKQDKPMEGIESWRALTFMVSDEDLLAIEAQRCGTEAWQTLHDLHQVTGISHIFDLQSKLFNLEMTDMSLKHFIVKIKSLNDEIAGLGGTKFEDNILILILIRALPEKFQAFKMVMQTFTESQANDYSFISKKILSMDDEAHQQHITSHSALFTGNKPRNRHKKQKRYCPKCKRKGIHTLEECKGPNYNGFKKPLETMIAMSATNSQLEKHEWVFDSGASRHYTGHFENLINVKEVKNPFNIATASGDEIPITHVGDANLEGCMLKNVFYSKNLTANLISMVAAMKEGVEMHCKNGKVNFWKNGRKILEATKKNPSDPDSLIIARGKKYTASVYTVSKPRKTLYEVHCELGHLSYSKILATEAHGELPYKLLDRYEVQCTHCLSCKMTRTTIAKNAPHKATKRGETISIDIWGPAQTTGINGERYMLIFVDNATGYATGKSLQNKSQALQKIKEYVFQFEGYFERTLLKMKSDNAKEMNSDELVEFLTAHGIRKVTTAPYSSETNGHAERMIRTIIEEARTMMEATGTPRSLWPQAIKHATYIYNHTWQRRANNIPSKAFWEERFIPMMPEKLLPFGQPIMVKNTIRGSKLEVVGHKGRYVGVEETSNGIYYFSNGKIKKTRNFRVLESQLVPEQEPKEIFIKSSTIHPRIIRAEKDEDDVRTEEPTNEKEAIKEPTPEKTNSSNEEVLESELPESRIENESTGVTEPLIRRTINGNPDFSEALENPNTQKIIDDLPKGQKFIIGKRVYRTIGKPGEYRNTDNSRVKFSDFGNTTQREYWLPKHTKRKSIPRINQGLMCLAVTLSLKENEIMDLPEVYQARLKEWEQIKANQTFDMIPRSDVPNGKKILPCRFVDSIKKDSAGFDVYKSRLVAGGHRETDVTLAEVFAPVVKSQSIRTLLAIAASLDWKLDQLDFVAAFLNADLSDYKYMEQPATFNDGTDQVLRLKKGLYGLRSAPKCWNNHLTNMLESLGFKPLKSDPMVLLNPNIEGNPVIIGIHVDDQLSISPSQKSLDKLGQMISSKAKVKLLGFPQKLLSINILKTKNSLTLDQSDYTEGLISEYDEEIKPEKIPAVLEKPDWGEEKKFNVKKYQKAIGGLIWLSINTRPDIAYAVSRAAGKMAAPSKDDWQQVLKIMGYLKETKHLGLRFARSTEKNVELQGYADADFAADYKDRKSRTGYIIFLNKCPIIWQSKKQRSVATSTTEAEYMSASDAAQDLIWVTQLLQELKLNERLKCTLNMDNTAALSISKNPINHGRSKHIDVRYHYLRERVQKGELEVTYKKSEEMIADTLTKPLNAPSFKRLRELTQVIEVNPKSGES